MNVSPHLSAPPAHHNVPARRPSACPSHPRALSPRAACTLIALFLLAIVASIVPPAGLAQSPPERYPYRATATVGMIGDVVGRIAGDRAEVTTMIGSGVDPHLYKATRTDIASLMRADIVFYNGLLLEGKMADTLATIARRKPVFAVSEALEPQWLLSGGPGGHHDPHVWMDADGWRRAAEGVVEALVRFDPPNADAYRQRGAVVLAELAELDVWARESIATIPSNQRVMVTAHDAFRYLGRAYDIEVHGVQGLSTESEAGLQDINRLVDMIIDRRIPAIFVETSVSDKNVEALREGAAARGWDVAHGGSLFSDAMGATGTWEGTYVGMIDHNVTTIVTALGGTVDAGGFRAWREARRSSAAAKIAGSDAADVARTDHTPTIEAEEAP
jgi:manganese/zinc/iron transport system substrate-binding protein